MFLISSHMGFLPFRQINIPITVNLKSYVFVTEAVFSQTAEDEYISMSSTKGCAYYIESPLTASSSC